MTKEASVSRNSASLEEVDAISTNSAAFAGLHLHVDRTDDDSLRPSVMDGIRSSHNMTRDSNNDSSSTKRTGRESRREHTDIHDTGGVNKPVTNPMRSMPLTTRPARFAAGDPSCYFQERMAQHQEGDSSPVIAEYLTGQELSHSIDDPTAFLSSHPVTSHQPPTPQRFSASNHFHGRHTTMGNDESTERQRTFSATQNINEPTQVLRPRSNLSALLESQHVSADSSDRRHEASAPASGSLKRQPMVFEEADSASGPVSQRKSRSVTDTSADYQTDRERTERSRVYLQPPSSTASSVPSYTEMTRRSSWSQTDHGHNLAASGRQNNNREAVRRCMSSKELGNLAPPSGSPFAFVLYQREVLEAAMQQRLIAAREHAITERSFTPSPAPVETSVSSEPERTVISTSKLTNEARNKRRAEHSRAVRRDLCEIVTDLFVAESKLLNPSSYGVQRSARQREQIMRTVADFLSALPPRYALGVETPSEVLLHMRLMAAARSDDTRAVVHIVDPESDASRREITMAPTHTRPRTVTRLVTIACADARGLLEYITQMLSTGGSRVVDADVMLTSDNIALDRFVVEMNGRLRLDKLANCIEAFLKQAKETEASDISSSRQMKLKAEAKDGQSLSYSPEGQASGPLYFHPPSPGKKGSPKEIQEEIQGAVPLSQVLASNNDMGSLAVPMRGRTQGMIRQQSLPNPGPTELDAPTQPSRSPEQASNADSDSITNVGATATRRKHHLVNREARSFSENGARGSVDFPAMSPEDGGMQQRTLPLIPFEELMLIETLGMGRVSTIYRAAWQKRQVAEEENPTMHVKMVALKVASVNPDTGDTSHVEELRREADIAAMLHHPHVCDLVGVAADSECFCLAYEFCEGGSLLSLLLDTSRYYEYLPIALDVANGMAFLHSCNIIHRDLKPSNVLLDGDHRAKISDFGMSVANTGQELTAETGTYRYMAPEVIRHESYSSNADVYSFGILLWQLITREVPFGTMTPIQAAWAVAEGRRPSIPPSTPPRLKEIICACWDQDSQKRPSFTYIAMALAEHARVSFSPANVGAQTLQIANEMLANVQGNSTVNVDFSTPVAIADQNRPADSFPRTWFGSAASYGSSTNVGLEI